MKAEMVEYLADAQKAAEEAEEERKAAEEAQKKAEEAALAAAKSYALLELAQMDTTGCNAEQKEAAEAVLAEAREAIQAAETQEEVAALLAEAQEAMEEAMNLVCASDLFRDVAENTWYHEGVDYMVRQGYMDGMGGGLFGVNGTMTRGQMVTILYRIAGKPSVEGLENPSGTWPRAEVLHRCRNLGSSQRHRRGHGRGRVCPRRRRDPAAGGSDPVPAQRRGGRERGPAEQLPRWETGGSICQAGHELGGVSGPDPGRGEWRSDHPEPRRHSNPGADGDHLPGVTWSSRAENLPFINIFSTRRAGTCRARHPSVTTGTPRMLHLTSWGPMEAQGTTVRPLRASGRSVSQKMGNFKRYTAVGAHGGKAPSEDLKFFWQFFNRSTIIGAESKS